MSRGGHQGEEFPGRQAIDGKTLMQEHEWGVQGMVRKPEWQERGSSRERQVVRPTGEAALRQG